MQTLTVNPLWLENPPVVKPNRCHTCWVVIGGIHTPVSPGKNARVVFHNQPVEGMCSLVTVCDDCLACNDGFIGLAQTLTDFDCPRCEAITHYI